MKFITVYGSSDPYSHEMSPILIRNGYDYSDMDIQIWVSKYTERFKGKQYSAISIVEIDVDPLTGHVEVITNVQGKHPIQEKVVVNPAAKAIRDARRANSPKYAPKKLSLSTAAGLFGNNVPITELMAQVNNAVNPQVAEVQVNPQPLEGNW